MVPIPQTGIAGTLNLGEELFPERKQERCETEIDGKEIDCKGENKYKKEHESAESGVKCTKGEKVADK